MNKLFSAIVGLFCLSVSVFGVGAARNWAYGAADLSSVNCLQDYVDIFYVGSAGNIVVYNSAGLFRKVAVSGDVTISESGVFAVTGISSLPLAESKIFIGSSSGLVTARTLTGDVTNSATGVMVITPGAITGSEITLEPAKILVGNATSNASAKTLSGDVTIDTNGVATASGLTSNFVVYGEGNTNFNFFVTNGLIKAFTVTGP